VPRPAHLIISARRSGSRSSGSKPLSFALLALWFSFPLREGFFALPFDTFKFFFVYLHMPVFAGIPVLASVGLEGEARKL
jgi:hypothetical protein